MNNAVFGENMENLRKHGDIKLLITEKRKNQLASKPNYHTRKYFSENLLAILLKKIEVKMNNSVYLGLALVNTRIYQNINA